MFIITINNGINYNKREFASTISNNGSCIWRDTLNAGKVG